jgi:tetratricopeptide (TPR) repeat protein
MGSLPPSAAPGGSGPQQPDPTAASETQQNAAAVFPFWSIPLLVAVLTFLTYSTSLYFGFVYDDRVQILNNPWLESWKYVSRFFSESSGAFTGSPGGAFWRPLFLLWMLVNRSLFGLQPWGWHLTTVALHSLTAVLVYLLALRLLRDRFLAAFAGLLFGVYPATVESAAWIAGATDPLMAVFLLASFLVYWKSWELQSRHVRALSLVLYVLALMVKETAVVLPLLVLCHAWLYRSQVPENLIPHGSSRTWTVLRSFLPYAAFTGIYLVERNLVLSPGQPPPEATGTKAMLLTWPKLLWFYLRLLFVPDAVSPHYNLKAQTEFSVTAVLAPALALLLLIAAIAWTSKKVLPTTRRQVWFALAWIFVPILPVLYIRRMAAGDFAHIRYLYLSVIGLGLLAALLVGKISQGKQRILNRPALQVAVVAVLVLGAAWLTLKNQLYWQNNFTLFAHAVEVAPNNARARTNYAVELGERRRFQEAVEQFQKALNIEPNLWYANIDLGYTYYLMGRYDEAIHWMQRGTELNPGDANQYTFLSAAQIRAGRLDQAEQSMRAAIERAPYMPSYHYALGLILEEQGKLEQAQEAYRQELEIDPSNAMARAKLEQASPKPSQ